jgi:pimeloyl-ACP methyl ester carboxylesterase
MNIETITRTPQTQTHKTPLLFVHGMWHGAWCWDEFFLPYFAEQGHHVTALSLRGHAGSEGQIKGSSIADYVHDVEQVAKTFDIPPVIIGHSMGGFITQKYLETNSAPVAVLLSPIPYFGAWPGTARVFMHSPLALMKVILLRRLKPAVETPADARWALFSKDMPEEQFLKYYARLDDESFRAYLDLLGLNLAHPKRVKTSLLVLGAEEDTVISKNNVNATAKAYHTKAEFFPNMGHDMMLGAGWKSVAERIVNWLNEKGI